MLRIANILISDSWGDVGPDALERGIGGREGAMVYLSREWARLGHEVTSFVNTDKGSRFYEDIAWAKWDEENPGHALREENGYHEYLPLNMTKQMLANTPWDVAIAWECPSAFNDDRIRENIPLRITEMQVAHLEGDELEAAEKNCQYVAALSPWHAEFLHHTGLETETVVFPNGCDLSRYPAAAVQNKIDLGPRGKPSFVYSSSPDRGLWHLLQAWKYIRAAHPGATLEVGYGATRWTDQVRWSHGRVGEMAVEIEKLLYQPGVKDIGKIGQGELAKKQMNADAWLYPLDSIQATETGCITAVENAAAGNPILTTDADCMESEFGSFAAVAPLPFDPESYSAGVSAILEEDQWKKMATKGREFAETRDWKVIAPQWLEFFKSHV